MYLSEPLDRLFGFCGPAGAAAAAWTAASGALPGLRAVAVPDPDAASGRAAGFALSGDRRPPVGAASTPDGSFLVLDGELDDDETHAGLPGALEGFLDEGPRHLERRRFAGLMAAWDAAAGRLAVMRDRDGIASGYVARVGPGVAFASRIDTLVRVGSPPTIDEVALSHFLTFGYYPAPASPIAGIVKIPPAHTVVVDGGVMAAPEPWPPGPAPDDSPIPDEEGTGVLRDRFEEALRRHPWTGRAGLLLSGGIDSGMILVGVRRILGEDIETFTFRYEGYGGPLNEGERARTLAEHLGAPHAEIAVSPDDLWDDMDDAVEAYGEPPTWGLHSYRLGPLAERGVTTLFSGVGPDGWGLSKRHAAALRFRRLPRVVRAAIRAGAPVVGALRLDPRGRVRWVSREVADLAELFYPEDPGQHDMGHIYRDPELPVRARRRALDLVRSAAADYPGTTDEGLLIYLNERLTSADSVLFWNTAWARAHGMALRLPYFDHDLVDAVMRTEGARTGKDRLRELAADHLPDEMAFAPKTPQEAPVAEWLRGPLADRARARLSDLPAALADVFEPRGVARVLDEHARGRSDHGWTIVALLAASSWYERITSLAGRGLDR